ncbi:MAG: hypothetical protein ACI9VR_005056 [Cognaticolwellia sp.]|jgi:hypothetical protein
MLLHSRAHTKGTRRVTIGPVYLYRPLEFLCPAPLNLSWPGFVLLYASGI